VAGQINEDKVDISASEDMFVEGDEDVPMSGNKKNTESANKIKTV
jgi:hypothetical protein